MRSSYTRLYLLRRKRSRLAPPSGGGAVLPNDYAWRMNAYALSGNDGDAISIPVVRGGSALPALNGSVKLVTNAINGLKGMRFDGNTLHEVTRASNAAYYAGQDTQNWTGHYLFTKSELQEYLNMLVHLNSSNDRLCIARAANNDAGLGLFGTYMPRGALSDGGTHVLSVRSTTASVAGQSATGQTVLMMDGIPFAMANAPVPKPGDLNGGGNSYMGGLKSGSGVIYGTQITLIDHVIYNKVQTLGEMYDTVKALRSSAGLGMAPKITMLVGSSLMRGEGADANAYDRANELMRQLNLPFGSIGVFALGGLDFDALRTMGTELDGLLTRVGPANCHLIVSEGYNTLTANSASVSVAKYVTYLQDRLAGGWLPQNMLLDTITGVVAERGGSERYPAFAAGVKAIPSTIPALAQARVINTNGNYSDNDPRIGIGGTSPTTDGVHRTGKQNYSTVLSDYPWQVDKVYKQMVAEIFGLEITPPPGQFFGSTTALWSDTTPLFGNA